MGRIVEVQGRPVFVTQTSEPSSSRLLKEFKGTIIIRQSTVAKESQRAPKIVFGDFLPEQIPEFPKISGKVAVDVHLHGSEDGRVFFAQYKNGLVRQVSIDEVAKTVRQQFGPNPLPANFLVRLHGCRCGANGTAQSLADALQRPVLAPEKNVNMGDVTVIPSPSVHTFGGSDYVIVPSILRDETGRGFVDVTGVYKLYRPHPHP